MGPALTGPDFLAVWDNKPLADLVTKIQTTMPQDTPGLITRQQATDLVAYVLQVGRFPAGQTELDTQDSALKEIALYRGRGAARG